MAALEATIHVRGTEGRARDSDRRLSSSARQHAAPRDGAGAGRSDHARHASAARAGKRSLYLKLRDRASYEFALASAAVVITIGGRKDHARAHRAGRRGHKAVAIARGRSRTDGSTRQRKPIFRKAAEAALRDAKPQSENGFKIELAKRCLVHALKLATQADLTRDRTCHNTRKLRRHRRSVATRRASTAR